MGKNRKNETKNSIFTISKVVGVLLIPGAVFWLLYRNQLFNIIDAFAVGVIASAGIVFGIKYLMTRKIIRFKK